MRSWTVPVAGATFGLAAVALGAWSMVTDDFRAAIPVTTMAAVALLVNLVLAFRRAQPAYANDNEDLPTLDLKP